MSRRRYLYTLGGQPLPEPVLISDDTELAPRRAQTATEELTYGGMRATDGTDISSRRKHRDYLKRNGLSMESDFSPETREKLRTQRIEKLQGVDPQTRKARRESIERAIHHLERGGKPPPRRGGLDD